MTRSPHLGSFYHSSDNQTLPPHELSGILAKNQVGDSCSEDQHSRAGIVVGTAFSLKTCSSIAVDISVSPDGSPSNARCRMDGRRRVARRRPAVISAAQLLHHAQPLLCIRAEKFSGKFAFLTCGQSGNGEILRQAQNDNIEATQNCSRNLTSFSVNRRMSLIDHKVSARRSMPKPKAQPV